MAYKWRASINLSCSCSVQFSLDLVIVYGFLIFFVGSSQNDIVWLRAETGIVVAGAVVWGRAVLKPDKFIFMGVETNENG